MINNKFEYTVFFYFVKQLNHHIMKILRWVGWVSVGIGAILIALGSVFQVTHMNPLHTLHNISNFEAGSSFILLGIALFIGAKNCCQECCNKDDKA